MNIKLFLRFVNKTMSSMHLCDIKSELFLNFTLVYLFAKKNANLIYSYVCFRREKTRLG